MTSGIKKNYKQNKFYAHFYLFILIVYDYKNRKIQTKHFIF